MVENIVCKDCTLTFKVHLTGGKNSNGSFERFYLDDKGALKIRCSKLICYKCFRAGVNKKKILIRGYCKSYEKTKNGFLMRSYRNMKSRVTGVQKKKSHLYNNKELLPKQDFYEWAKFNKQFHILFDEWEALGYPRKLTPSVDRIKSTGGYTLDNMQFITHSENSRKTSKNGY